MASAMAECRRGLRAVERDKKKGGGGGRTDAGCRVVGAKLAVGVSTLNGSGV